MILPTAKEVSLARREIGFTQLQAGRVAHVTARAWRKWETDETKPDNRQIPGAAWELFLIKTKRFRHSGSRFLSPRH